MSTETPTAPSTPPGAETLTAPAASPATNPGFKAALMQFTERFGHMMSRVLLTIMYIGLVAPAGLVLTYLGDRLRIRTYSGTSWVPCTFDNETVEKARRQD